MRRKVVHRPGSSSACTKRCERHRLQGFAKADGAIAIIQDQRRAAMAGDSACDLFAQRRGGRRGFVESPVGRARACRPESRRVGTGNGANAKSSLPSFATTMRSHQPRGVFTYWRIGRASKNSLAITSSGRSPRTSKCAVQRMRAHRCRALFALHFAQHRDWPRPEPLRRSARNPARRLQRAQRVRHQSAAAGAQFDQMRMFLGLP